MVRMKLITTYSQLRGGRLDKDAQLELVERLNVRGSNGALRKTPKALNRWLLENDYDYVITTKQYKLAGVRYTGWLVSKI